MKSLNEEVIENLFTKLVKSVRFSNVLTRKKTKCWSVFRTCRVQAQMQHETKLVKKFEEFDDWGREVEFFSWSPVDFLLYVEDCIVGESGEIG